MLPPVLHMHQALAAGHGALAGAELGIPAARIADALLSVPVPVARDAPQYWAASIIRQASDLLRAEGRSRLPS